MDHEVTAPVQSRILIVDDQRANVEMLTELLQAENYVNLVSTMDPFEALKEVEREIPDLILLDLIMPGLDGFDVMRRIRGSIPAGYFLPIIVLTADASDESRDRALREGANDFLTKPIDHTELLLRVSNLLQTGELHAQLRSHNRSLEMRVRERTAELREALKREKEQAHRLRESEQVKDALLVAVSHDIRTPLTVVVGLAETLNKRSAQLSSDQMNDLTRRLYSGARRLESVLTTLLDVDRLRRGLVQPVRREVAMHTLVRRVVEGLEASMDHRCVILTVRDLFAQVDAAQVERILENLISNAIRHASDGTTIWIGCQPSSGGILLTVRDDGPGVPDQEKARIFEPFEGNRDHPSPGSGNGLTLVSGFAALHGGAAWVEDSDEGGASFNVFLPTPVRLSAEGDLALSEPHELLQASG